MTKISKDPFSQKHQRQHTEGLRKDWHDQSV